MPQKPLTSKQQYWLRHVTAADASDSSMAQYAQSKQLSVRKLYHWKSQLMKLDLYLESSDVAPASFVKLDVVSDNRWQIDQVPIVSGENIIRVEALDAAGNRSTEDFRVTQEGAMLIL